MVAPLPLVKTNTKNLLYFSLSLWMSPDVLSRIYDLLTINSKTLCWIIWQQADIIFIFIQERKNKSRNILIDYQAA